MRHLAILLVIVFMSISFSSLADACIDLKAAKASYLPGETAQIEINADVTRTITTADVAIYRNSSKLQTAVFLSKISNTKYFMWFDIPSQQGIYYVKVRGSCPELKTSEIAIDVQGTAGAMQAELRSAVKDRWKTLPLESHILAAGVFSEDEISSQAISDYLKRSDSCTNYNCSTKNAALTLAAFSDIQISEKMLNMLESYRNGKKYNETNETILNISCWGSGQNESCSSEDTSYALLALAMKDRLELNNSKNTEAIAWLKSNAKNIEEKSILYYITKDSAILSEILGAQDSGGFWKDNNSKADARATALALFALKNSNSSATSAIEKSRTWLKNQKFSLSDECFVLFFAFPLSETEPIISIWPGMIKTSSEGSFSVIVTNKGVGDVKITASLFDSNAETIIGKNSIKNMQFKMPLATTTDGRTIFSNLLIKYNEIKSTAGYSYSIPLVIFTEKGAVDQIGTTSINMTENTINGTQQQEIINGTNPLENKTTNTNASLLQEKFSFDEKNISAKAGMTDKQIYMKITLSNHLDGEITDIEMSPQISLQQNEFVKVDPIKILSLGAGEKKNITVIINPSAGKSQTYHGYIQASGKYKGTAITSYIPVSIEIKGGGGELLSCEEQGGMICSDSDMSCAVEMTPASDNNYCCAPAEKCSKKAPAGRGIGFIIIAVVVIILIAILMIIKRRPKKEMKEFLEEKAKEYELKKTQRPSSIDRKI